MYSSFLSMVAIIEKFSNIIRIILKKKRKNETNIAGSNI